MRYVAMVLMGLVSLAPFAAACNGLSPGDEFRYAKPDGEYLCTLAFILADENGLYFATAGHCVQNGTIVKTPDGKAFGVGVYHYLSPETNSTSDGSPGYDFGLIEIDAAWYDKLNPAVCGWGGPKGIYREKPGGGDVRHYGHGLIIGDISPKRSGTNLQNDNFAFHWLGEGLPGDSGSAVLSADGRALGVLTHLAAGLGTTNGGTHIDRGFALAKDGGFPNLRLVLDGEDPVEVLRSMRAANDKPQPNTIVDPTPKPSPNTGSGAPPPSQTPPTSSTTPTPTQDAGQSAGAVQEPADGDAKSVPGIETALLIAAVLGVALRRRAKTL